MSMQAQTQYPIPEETQWDNLKLKWLTIMVSVTIASIQTIHFVRVGSFHHRFLLKTGEPKT
jgi:hypothetical protein